MRGAGFIAIALVAATAWFAAFAGLAHTASTPTPTPTPASFSYPAPTPTPDSAPTPTIPSGTVNVKVGARKCLNLGSNHKPVEVTVNGKLVAVSRGNVCGTFNAPGAYQVKVYPYGSFTVKAQ